MQVPAVFLMFLLPILNKAHTQKPLICYRAHGTRRWFFCTSQLRTPYLYLSVLIGKGKGKGKGEVMVITILGWLMIAVFMFVVMTKKLSPLVSLCTIPLVFALIMLIATGNISQWTLLGDWVMNGLGTTANTGILLLFAILYFSIMLDAGLFDPITKKMIQFAKGDPMKVLIATAVVAASISMNGDGTTTTLVCCAAFLPIYEKLGMKKMNLAVLVILQNTVMNLLPWGGPTARAMAVCEVGGDILSYLMPGMIISVIFNIVVVARFMGKQERKRLGVTEFTQAEIDELCAVDDP